jgi:S-adenosylmethionine:tRNA ribosyltransferase-isomerase
VATARLTLHVGPGTFRPPSAEQIAARRLHPERFVLPAATTAALAACRRRGGRVVAVGTTSLRVLETVARLPLPDGAPDGAVVPWEGDGQEPAPVFTGTARREGGHWAVAGTTRLFLRPPDRITAADGLLTNFHLPGSSLLMLIAAVTGEASWRAAYAEAVARRLRFFSYGDAMLVLPPEAPTP